MLILTTYFTPIENGEVSPFTVFNIFFSYINVNENVTLSSKKCHDKSSFFQGRKKYNTV